MDQWAQMADVPDLVASSTAFSTNEWEDWLKWDPATESRSPDTSSKDSSDSPLQDMSSTLESFPWIDDKTIDPSLFVSEQVSPIVADSVFNLDTSAIDFAPQSKNVDSFIFGGGADVFRPTDNAQRDAQQRRLGTTLAPEPQSERPSTSSTSRRASGSTTTNEAVDSLLPSPSPNTAQSSASSLSPQPSAPPKKKVGRKRKSDMLKDGEEPPVKKTSHNVIEKRYRNNLNDKILELRDSVPSLRAMSKSGPEEEDSEDLEGLTPAHKLNKSTIMAKATEYIKHLEKRNKAFADEMASLKSRLQALEQSQGRTSALTGMGDAIMTRERQPSFSGSAFGGMTAGTMQQQPSPTFVDNSIDDIDMHQTAYSEGSTSGSFMSKLMVSGMAGLMALEGFAEHNQNGSSPSDRGLFAAPLHLLRRSTLSPGAAPPSVSSSQLIVPLLKLTFVMGAVVHVLLPLLRSRPHRKPTSIPHITLTAAPSLASPVKIRRKAWLTAIQSVWTPRPFLLEVVAVTFRMIELSARRIIGFDRYAELLGTSKDDEAARIKAWDIAIDAQLAGGDAEVSYYRLLLTLMASGTLPDSPTRLMQKAVHFRIFFWEVANAGYGNMFMFKDFTAYVARIYWDLARNQHKALCAGNTSNVDEIDHSIEPLPEHLAALIELECDEVLTDDMIQRAYNLAWNRPSAENTAVNPTLDSVVEDPAIRSPLDAIAGWFTNTIIDEALALSTQSTGDISSDLKYFVDLATATAPPASSTLTRAHVARAILISDERETSIAAALESMPHVSVSSISPSSALGRSSTTTHLNVVNHIPLTPEVRTALTLAKLLSIADPKNPPESQCRAALALDALPIVHSQMTLLIAIASYKVLGSFASNPLLFVKGKKGLEQLAFSLRLWVGMMRVNAKTGTVGLQSVEKGMIIKRCVAVTRRLGGWRMEDGDCEELDSGYGSSGGEKGCDEPVVPS